MKTVKSGVYKIINIINGKVYVGSAKNFKNRWKGHKKVLTKNKHHSRHLQAAWNKYGEKNFSFEILEIVKDKTQLIKREQFWIDCYEAANREKGYNVCPIAGSCLGGNSS